MTVQLLHNTPLWVCARAIRKCWASESKSDTITPESAHDGLGLICGEKDKELIDKIGNKNKHGSTLEHLNYTFDISGISRACLQELARHRVASLSVKSTRYTLKELKKYNFSADLESDWKKYLVDSGNSQVNTESIKALLNLRLKLVEGISNDNVKYCLPEAYKTELMWTINARSLQNFLALRTSPSALWEIRDLALAIYKALPEDHKYLFKDSLYDKRKI